MTRAGRFAAAFISMIFHAACSVGGQVQDPAAPAPTLEEIRGATITGLFSEPVTLSNGRWEGDPYETGGSSRSASVSERTRGTPKPTLQICLLARYSERSWRPASNR